MKIGVSSVATYIPEGRLDNMARVKALQTDVGFLREKIGTGEVSRMMSFQETSDLAVEACRRLLEKSGATPDKIECLILCTQNPDKYGIPHTSAAVHAKLALSEQCACFDISLGCSGYVYGLSIASAFMEANGMHTGVFVTADPYSKIIDPMDRNTALLFGDAATATLLQTEDKAIYLPRSFVFGTRGQQGAAISNPSGRLEMNGRTVFEFCISSVPAQIRKLLDQHHLSVNDIDGFLLHQGSRFIVEQLARSLLVPLEKVPLKIEGIGNTVSSSLPILLQDYVSRNDAQKLVLSGFGVGLSWASCLLERNNN